MTITNVSGTPNVWTETELAEQSKVALEEFVERRLAEPSGKYLAHVSARRTNVIRLFKALVGVDASAPDPSVVRDILLDDELFDALRYVTGPPVSEDDLGVLVTHRVEGMSRGDIRESEALPIDVLKLVCRLADPFRYPWIAGKRAPTKRELRTAIQTTMTMHAA